MSNRVCEECGCSHEDGNCPKASYRDFMRLALQQHREDTQTQELWKEQILIEIPEVRYQELLAQNTQLRAHLTELTSITATLSPDSAVATWEALGAVTGKVLEGLMERTL